MEDLEADSDVAFPPGSMTAEILTNSFKHAFPPGTPGRGTACGIEFPAEA